MSIQLSRQLVAALLALAPLALDCPLVAPLCATPQQRAAAPRTSSNSLARATQSVPPSGFGALSMTGPAAGGTVRSIGTTVTVQTSAEIYFWSAITRQWTVLAVGPAAVMTQFNAYCLVVDGNTVHGYASRLGSVETLQLAAPPQVYSGPVTSGWVSVVASGSDAYAFGAMNGRWVHQALTAPPTNVQITAMTGYVEDGATLYGVSAYLGTFTPTPAVPGATLQVSGEVAVAWSPTEVASYSSHHGTWARRSMIAGQQLGIGRGYVWFEDAGEAVAFSAATAAFATAPMTTGAAVQTGNYVGALVSGQDVLAYSSGPGAFAARTFQGAVTVSTDDEVLVVQDAAGATGFSVAHDDFSPTLAGNFVVTLNDAVGYAEGAGVGYGYSLLTNDWSAAQTLAPGAQVNLQRNIVVIADGSGYSAFSGRTGRWTSIATGVAYDFAAPSSGDTFIAYDGARALAFDPTLDRFAEVAAPTPFQASDVFRTVCIGLDAVGRLHGYGLMSHEWTTVVPQGTFVQLDASSSCGYALTSTHLYPFSAHGSLSSLSRFPEFSRIQPIGAPLRLLQVGAPGSSVIGVFGLGAAYLPGQAYGTLYLDPTMILRRLPLGIIQGNGLLDESLDLSAAAALRGTALHIQCLVTPPIGQPWLSNLIAPVLL
ncbi:MAG: hypothetical protein R3F49_03770 [Planctomycetota bacterium]